MLSCDIFKILKSNHNRCDIIKCTFEGRKLKHSVYRETTLFMSRFFIPTIFRSLPDHSHYLLVIQFFINSITSENDEIIIVSDFETLNIRCRDYYSGITPIFLGFSFYVTDSSRYRQTTREYSMGSDY